MNNNKKIAIWLPIIIAASIALGIFIGNHFFALDLGMRQIYSGKNKINTILDVIDKQYVDTVNIANLIEETIPKIFGELDPHSSYIPAEYAAAVHDELEGSFSGIGVSFNMQTDTIIVINVVSGGPSEKAGILPFDRIISINDTVYAGKKAYQEEVKEKLRGAKNSTVKLGVQRGSSPDLIYFDVTRGDVPNYSVDVSYVASKGIGYIKVSKFARTTYNEFITGIAKLKQEGCSGFIIDLRGNSGGYMESAINMINEFLPEGKLIVYTEGKAFKRNDIYSNGTGTCIEAPLVVLVDELSGSASEIFAGAIQDNDRGLIIGRRTYGKGLVQTPIPLSDGSEIRLTIARYYTPTGRCIQKMYELGKVDEYDQDLYNRYLHGEFDSADSIKVNGAEEFKTPAGRTVYGGGGIMPDIFVPRDTSGYTSYYINAFNTGIIHQYVLFYSDANHKTLSGFNTYQELANYLDQQPLVENFATYAEGKGIRKRPALIQISHGLLKQQMEAYIVRNFFDNEGFYPIFLRGDQVMEKAVENIKNGTWNPSVSLAQK